MQRSEEGACQNSKEASVFGVKGESRIIVRHELENHKGSCHEVFASHGQDFGFRSEMGSYWEVFSGRVIYSDLHF